MFLEYLAEAESTCQNLCRSKAGSRRSFSVLPFIHPGGSGKEARPMPQPADSTKGMLFIVIFQKNCEVIISLA